MALHLAVNCRNGNNAVSLADKLAIFDNGNFFIAYTPLRCHAVSLAHNVGLQLQRLVYSQVRRQIRSLQLRLICSNLRHKGLFALFQQQLAGNRRSSRLHSQKLHITVHLYYVTVGRTQISYIIAYAARQRSNYACTLAHLQAGLLRCHRHQRTKLGGCGCRQVGSILVTFKLAAFDCRAFKLILLNERCSFGSQHIYRVTVNKVYLILLIVAVHSAQIGSYQKFGNNLSLIIQRRQLVEPAIHRLLRIEQLIIISILRQARLLLRQAGKQRGGGSLGYIKAVLVESVFTLNIKRQRSVLIGGNALVLQHEAQLHRIIIFVIHLCNAIAIFVYFKNAGSNEILRTVLFLTATQNLQLVKIFIVAQGLDIQHAVIILAAFGPHIAARSILPVIFGGGACQQRQAAQQQGKHNSYDNTHHFFFHYAPLLKCSDGTWQFWD